MNGVNFVPVAHRVPASILHLSSAVPRITCFRQTYSITGKGDKPSDNTSRLLSYYWLLRWERLLYLCNFRRVGTCLSCWLTLMILKIIPTVHWQITGLSTLNTTLVELPQNPNLPLSLLQPSWIPQSWLFWVWRWYSCICIFYMKGRRMFIKSIIIFGSVGQLKTFGARWRKLCIWLMILIPIWFNRPVCNI